MDKATKQHIINFNKQFNLNTEFVAIENILGYALNNTIYINESIDQDYERTNRHELLHFFEKTEGFQKLKKQVSEEYKNTFEQIKNEYELRYSCLYSENEIKSGILENEIVIDLLIDDSIIKFDNGLYVDDTFLGNTVESLKQKKYLNITINNNVKYMNLTKWEKLFVVNYYDGKEKQIPKGKNRLETIRNEININLKKLYDMDELDFLIDPHSPEIIRKYENKLKSLKQKVEDTSEFETDKENVLKNFANNSSKRLWKEYKHIVDFIKNEDYEPAFKYLMINETLTKTYKKDSNGEKTRLIIKKRNLNKSIAGHMILNKTTLDAIYNNLENYKNFANMYFAALEIFKKDITKKNVLILENIETFGKGKWLKFEGKTLDEDEYSKNVERLASLVKDTPWCTKLSASRQLAEEDFYIFIDNNEKAHIAITMNEKEIDEVRGIYNGSGQELEEEYRDVALAFLEKNKDIKNGKEWIEKEKWNKRLIEYNKKIESEEFTKEDVSNLIKDLFFVKDYKNHYCIDNSNKVKLRKHLYKIKGQLAEYFKCSKEEICTEDFDFSATDNIVCPYIVIFGNVNSGNSNADLSKLKIIGGHANFKNAQISSIPNLQIIAGDACFSKSQLISLENLKYIVGRADFSKTQMINLENLQTIGEDADFEYSQITNLENLQDIGGSAYFRNSEATNLKNLRNVGGTADFKNSQVLNLENLQTIGRHADFRNSQVTNLKNLSNIGGTAYWEGREDLKQQYEETLKSKIEELLQIAVKQRKNEFLEFIDEVKNFTLENSNDQKDRGEDR